MMKMKIVMNNRSCDRWNEAFMEGWIFKVMPSYRNWNIATYSDVEVSIDYCPFCGSKLGKEGCTGNNIEYGE